MRFNEYANKDALLKGRVEIIRNDTNEKILDTENLILASTRIAILYNLFRDPKILSSAYSADNLLKKPTDSSKSNYIPTICGFMFGCNGANISNPSILRVPSPTDDYSSNNEITLDKNTTKFIPIPILSITSDGTSSDGTNSYSVINSAGSFTKISDFINNPVVTENSTISDSSTSIIKYFTPDDIKDGNNFYCKAITTSNSSISIDEKSSEIEYIIKFNVEPYDLIGKSFNEIGLVLANCDIQNGNIVDIDTSTVKLASRLTFDEISLSRQLLTSFNIRYHIYI